MISSLIPAHVSVMMDWVHILCDCNYGGFYSRQRGLLRGRVERDLAAPYSSSAPVMILYVHIILC